MIELATHTRTFRNRRVLGIGEAMLEFASVDGGLYRRGYAGDTLNTCWHLAQIVGEQGQVSYYTRVGEDLFSAELVAFIAQAGVGVERIARDPARSLGLYVISLTGAERSFSYWRDTSAARCLADDPAALRQAVEGFGLIHISGITLAIVGETGRRNMIDALRAARTAGAVISFDPNLRRRLWSSEAELREAMRAMFAITDIALPSFDDEASLWGDATVAATVERLAALGVAEIVVKNGEGDVALAFGGMCEHLPTPEIAIIRDTTGAGDSFNAGYLAARLIGRSLIDACQIGQRVAGEVIGHFGALAPASALAALRELVAR